MLFYNIPAFSEGDVDGFLTAVARSNSLLKKVCETSPLLSLSRCAHETSHRLFVTPRAVHQILLLPPASFYVTGVQAESHVTQSPQQLHRLNNRMLGRVMMKMFLLL